MITLKNILNIDEIEGNIIVGLDKDNAIFKNLNLALNKKLESFANNDVITTLNLIKARKIYLFDKEITKASIKEMVKIKNASILIDSFVNGVEYLEKIATTFTSENYIEQTHKSKKEELNSNITIICENIEAKNKIHTGEIIGNSINIAKHLVNEPSNYLNAEQLAEYTTLAFANFKKIKVEIYDEFYLAKQKMGAFLGVNKGSFYKPRLIVIKYQGLKKFEDPTCFVGKGITFDTGGYSLKRNMINMKTDMAGSASVIGALKGIAELDLPVNVMGIIGATDNRLSPESIVPDDILTSMSGKTIEITSTDAEGRLVLCDVLWYAQKQGAKKIIDIATLTGSAANTFGGEFTASFTNNETFLKEFKKTSRLSDENVWQLPLHDPYFKLLKSTVADMKNSAGIPAAGASTAAIFLKQFIQDDTKWIHLDIAGTASKDSLATGVMVKSFINFVR
ncbi:MAG: leucyl aminopeptidase family protein [Bacilli bacterium]|nr:leucyl aminopeptidase family protein [Bacilli bacterium]